MRRMAAWERVLRWSVFSWTRLNPRVPRAWSIRRTLHSVFTAVRQTALPYQVQPISTLSSNPGTSM